MLTLKVVPQPETPETEAKSKVSQPGTSKSSSKSSIRSRRTSQESLKDASSMVPINGSCEGDINSDNGTDRTAKSSSESSVKSKACIASVKTKTGSQASLKKEINAEVQQTEILIIMYVHPLSSVKDGPQPEAEETQANDTSGQMPKTSSKSSVRSKASKTSVKSKSGSQASLKNDADATDETTKSSSKMPVKSKTSNVSLKSKSHSKTSLKDDSKESLKVFSCSAKVTYTSLLGSFLFEGGNPDRSSTRNYGNSKCLYWNTKQFKPFLCQIQG